MQDRQKPEPQPFSLPLDLAGFWELRGGLRLQDDPAQDDVSLAETRLQLTYDKYTPELISRGRFRFTGDMIYDAMAENHDVDLEEGEGFFDLREFWAAFTPVDFLDVKVGRQILTWGTGNLVFLNDLFPKDYQSFFLGRQLDYLKAPSDAIKFAFYSGNVGLDLVYTPRFDADRFVDGTRLSFFDTASGDLRGEDAPLETEQPDTWFEDHEVALRVHGSLEAYEWGLYGYTGFWKSPAGTDPQTGKRIFPELSAYGASFRGPVGAGIGNAEFSWYDSREDRDGDDPFVENSQLRFLTGYEQEIAEDLTLGVQYYLEFMLAHHAYEKNLPAGFPAREKARQWLTLDLNQELLAQNQLRLSLFIFYSTATKDAYLRPLAAYDATDRWKVEVGANLFMGDRDTFFGQFEENSNVYAAARYGF